MERRDVANVIAQLEREGKAVSNMNIKRLLGYGSMRDVVAHRKALATPLDDAPDAPEPPVPPVRAADPVALAEAMVADAEAQLDAAHEVMREAALTLLLSGGVLYQGTRYCAFLPGDPVRDLVVQHAAQATDAYHAAMAALERAKDHLASTVRKFRRERQEAHVQRHQPELRQQRDHWQHQVTHAISDRMHAEAKKNLQRAIFDYERAVATAAIDAE